MNLPKTTNGAVLIGETHLTKNLINLKLTNLKPLIKHSNRLFIAVIFTASIFSCKKNIETTEATETIAQIAAKNKAAIFATYGNISAAIANPNPFTTTGISYITTSGTKQSLLNKQTRGVIIPNTNYVCGSFDCATATNASQLEISGGIASSTRLVKCQNSTALSDAEYTWYVSAPFTINPTQGIAGNTEANTTYTDAFGGSVTINTPLTAANVIVQPVIKPSCKNKYYKITYVVKDVPNDYFNAGATILAQLSLYNDCALINRNVTLVGYSQNAVPNTYNQAPCARVDRPFINPGAGTTTNPVASVTGLYTSFCGLPGGMVGIDEHQIEFRKKTVASNNWDDQINSLVKFASSTPTSQPNQNTINPYSGTVFLSGTSQGSGAFIIRYRNIKAPSCLVSSVAGSNWSSFQWQQEIWTF
jgi:hypothetical protein